MIKIKKLEMLTLDKQEQKRILGGASCTGEGGSNLCSPGKGNCPRTDTSSQQKSRCESQNCPPSDGNQSWQDVGAVLFGVFFGW